MITVGRRGRRVVGVLLAVVAVGLSSCTTGDGGGAPLPGINSGSNPQPGGTLTAAIAGDPSTLDWGINTDALTIDIAQNIFELLFAPDRNFKIRPMLASRYSTSRGGRTYTLELRRGVRFQNGQVMTSADVVASMRRWFLVSGEGQSVAKDVKSVRAAGADTVVVALDRPRYSFISSLASFLQPCIIMPASIARAAGKKTLTDKQLVGTGPYEFEKYEHGQYVELARFPQYSSRTDDVGGLAGAKRAYIDKLKFQVVTDATQRLNGLRTGQWQFAGNLDLDAYDQISLDHSIVPYAEANSLIEFALLNSGSGAFSKLAARRGLNLLMDKEGIATATLGPESLWRPLGGAFAFRDNTPMYSDAGHDIYRAHDVDKARRLFAQAGVRSSTPIRILTTHTYENYYQEAVVLQAELRSIGLRANLQVYDFPTMISKLTESPDSWDISMTSFAGEPLNPAQLLFLSPTWPGGFKSRTIDALMARYDASSTAAQAHRVVDQLQQAVWTELPDIAIGRQVLLSAGSKSLKNYQNFIGQGFWNAYLSS